jgi:hypothetical protein
MTFAALAFRAAARSFSTRRCETRCSFQARWNAICRFDFLHTVMVNKISGQVTTVQEQRFRLIAEDGRGFLFTLSDGSSAIKNLSRWQATGLKVDVEYTGEPNVVTGVAHAVKPHVPD